MPDYLRCMYSTGLLGLLGVRWIYPDLIYHFGSTLNPRLADTLKHSGPGQACLVLQTPVATLYKPTRLDIPFMSVCSSTALMHTMFSSFIHRYYSLACLSLHGTPHLRLLFIFFSHLISFFPPLSASLSLSLRPRYTTPMPTTICPAWRH